MSNPYQPFFDKLDRTVSDLEADGGVDQTHKDAADLLRRSGFVLANLLNVQAQAYPHIILDPDPEVVQDEAEDTDTPSVDQPE